MIVSAHPGAGSPHRRIRPLLASLQVVVIALVAFAAVMAPTAGAEPNRVLTFSFEIENGSIYDSALSRACGTTIVAGLSGVVERKVVLGKNGNVAAHETKTFDGQITWFNQAAGTSYTDKLKSTSRIEYPEGIDLFLPAHVTVTGRNGGTFPVAGGPPGTGKFEYDALIYATDDEGFPYIFETSDPTWTGPSFDNATARICAALV
jgi:hypothetical protein